MSLVSIFFAYNDVNDSFGGIVIELVNNCCHSIEVDDNIDIDDNIYQFELFFRYGNNNGNDVVVENAGENDDAKWWIVVNLFTSSVEFVYENEQKPVTIFLKMYIIYVIDQHHPVITHKITTVYK